MTLKLTSFGELIAAKAAPRDNKTHRPCTFQVIKNHENLVFIIVNLLSSPSFLTLQNKKDPRRIAQTEMKVEKRMKNLINKILFSGMLLFLSSTAFSYSISGDSFKANLEIDTINFGQEYAVISASGRAGEYGAVYADYKLMPSNDQRNSGTISGLARAINADGVLTGANLTGVYKRNGGIISIYMLDELTNGVIHYVEGTINVVTKKIEIEVYPK